MKIKIDDILFLSEITLNDTHDYVTHLQEKQISDQTLTIPYPYNEDHAKWWINFVDEDTKRQGKPVILAIRSQNGSLIGSIGLHDFELGKSHKAEIGYWLAKPYWNQGIVTKAVCAMCNYAFNELGLVRITAHVFDFNTASARVLEKANFKLEGTLRNHYKKNGEIFDAKLYALINS